MSICLTNDFFNEEWITSQSLDDLASAFEDCQSLVDRLFKRVIQLRSECDGGNEALTNRELVECSPPALAMEFCLMEELYKVILLRGAAISQRMVALTRAEMAGRRA